MSKSADVVGGVRMTSEIKIQFGRSSNGEMISIDAALRGLSCECCCAACGAPLVARKGEKNRHHFAHHIESENCVEARETALHKFAKQVICKTLALRLPDNFNLGKMCSATDE